MKTKDTIILAAGVFGAVTLLNMAHDHVDENEESKGWRIIKKVGLYAAAFAIGELLVDINDAGRLARDIYDGTIDVDII